MNALVCFDPFRWGEANLKRLFGGVILEMRRRIITTTCMINGFRSKSLRLWVGRLVWVILYYSFDCWKWFPTHRLWCYSILSHRTWLKNVQRYLNILIVVLGKEIFLHNYCIQKHLFLGGKKNKSRVVV